jgi:hypothetical protein
MAAAVSATSAVRLASGRARLSGNSALVEGAGSPEAGRVGTGPDACAAGPLKATGRATAACEVSWGGTGALLAGALWRPTE